MNLKLTQPARVKLNGKIYPGVQEASWDIGISPSAIYKLINQLKNSARSEISVTLKIPTEIVIQKIKGGE